MSKPLARAARRAKTSRARSGEKKIGIQPSAISAASATSSGRSRRGRSGSRRAAGAASASAACRARSRRRRGRDLVVLAVVLERLAAQHRAHDLDVLARLRERLAPRLGRASPRRPAGPRRRARAGSARRRAGRASSRSSPCSRACGRDLHDRRAELDRRRRRGEPGEDVTASVPSLGRPRRVEAEPLGLLRERDQLGGFSPG